MASSSMVRTQKRLTHSQVGMFVTMASFTMLFGTLLLSYLLIRSRQPSWPPIGVDPLKPWLPLLSTAILLLSSYVLHRASDLIASDKATAARPLWRIGTLLGGAFMFLQILICWNWRMQGIVAGDSLFASIIYTLIGVHFFHALASWGSLVWIYFKKSAWNPASEAAKMATWFWHFLDAVWIITFILIFLG